VQQAREAARRLQCKNNLKQLGLALHNYESAHSTFPPSRFKPDTCIGAPFDPSGDCAANPNTSSLLSWTVLVLPYFDQAPLSNVYNYNLPWWYTGNDVAINNQLPVFKCPSTPRSTETDPVWGPALNGSTFLAAAGDYGSMNEIKKDYFTSNGLPDISGTSRTDGVLVKGPAARIRDITDGLSQTCWWRMPAVRMSGSTVKR
jgi:hypothetical protein